MSAVCTVWFYDPAKERVTGLNIVNKVVSGLDPPFCHTELQFPCGEACSVVMGGRVGLRVRTFDPEFYTGVFVRARANAVCAAQERARGHVMAGTSFGVFGGRTYCSRLVADLLCESGMVLRAELGLGVGFVTPSALFRGLERLGDRRGSAEQSPAMSIDFKTKQEEGSETKSSMSKASKHFVSCALGFRDLQQHELEDGRRLLGP